jgi:hypothetical protein
MNEFPYLLSLKKTMCPELPVKALTGLLGVSRTQLDSQLVGDRQ